jgi:hypothetical protein
MSRCVLDRSFSLVMPDMPENVQRAGHPNEPLLTTNLFKGHVAHQGGSGWTPRGAHLLLQTRTKVLTTILRTSSAVGTRSFTLVPLGPPDLLTLSLLRRKRGKRSKQWILWPQLTFGYASGISIRFECLTSNGGPLTTLASTPTSTSLRWSRKRLGVQRWQDGRIWGDAVNLWFSASRARQPSVSRHAGVLFCAFPSLFCRPSGILRPILSLTSDRWRSSRPVDRGALVLRVSCRKSCRNLDPK